MVQCKHNLNLFTIKIRISPLFFPVFSPEICPSGNLITGDMFHQNCIGTHSGFYRGCEFGLSPVEGGTFLSAFYNTETVNSVRKWVRFIIHGSEWIFFVIKLTDCLKNSGKSPHMSFKKIFLG